MLAGPLIGEAGVVTSVGALAHAIPQLCVPQAADQFRNAAAVSTAGAGRQLLDDVDVDIVQHELRSLLSDSTTRARATALSDEIRAMPTAGHVAAVIAGLAGTTA